MSTFSIELSTRSVGGWRIIVDDIYSPVAFNKNYSLLETET
jgi:hypothetical protein